MPQKSKAPAGVETGTGRELLVRGWSVPRIAQFDWRDHPAGNLIRIGDAVRQWLEAQS